MGIKERATLVMMLKQEKFMFLILLYLLNTILFTLFPLDYHMTSSSDFTHIDHCGLDDNVSNNYNFKNFMIDTTLNHDTIIHLSPVATQQTHMIVNSMPLLHYVSCDCKSTQLYDFIYSTYSTSFYFS